MLSRQMRRRPHAAGLSRTPTAHRGNRYLSFHTDFHLDPPVLSGFSIRALDKADAPFVAWSGCLIGSWWGLRLKDKQFDGDDVDGSQRMRSREA